MKFPILSKSVFAAILGLLSLFSCKSVAHPKEFCWTKEQSEFAEIQTQVAGPGIIQNFIQVSGKVVTHPDHLAYVIPKVNGAAWDIRKNLGESVEEGEILALIESKEVADAKANYLSTLKKLKIQQTLLDMEKVLRGVSAEQDYLKASLANEEALIDSDCAIQHLYALGFSEEDIGKIAQEHPANRRFYEMKSPLKGKILQRNLILGERVDPSTKAFTIANFEKVWVEINIAQNDVQHLQAGLPVEIMGGEKRAHVTVSQFNPMISDETRMATAVAVLENSSEKWTPGEFVGVRVQTHNIAVPLVVAREAIQNIKGEPHIFVEDDGGFSPRIVKVGNMDENNVEIVSGLQIGESYAAGNAFCLKAEYEKEDFDD